MRHLIALCGILSISLSATSFAADIDWSKVDEALGKKGAAQAGGIYKYGLPRSDLNVMVDGVKIKPTLALGSWVAFMPTADGAMVMGDLVLTETELSPVMQRLIEQGIEVSAIHNHLIRATPAVVYMHIAGHGEPIKLAHALHDAIALSKTPFASSPASAPATTDFNVSGVESALGYKANNNGGVYQFSVPRAESISENGMAIPPSMGTAIAINFQPNERGKAAITGDFVLLGKEVNPIIKALRSHGIEVTALHSHMIDDSPHLYFMHFWANDDALKLAKGLRAALNLANVKPAS